MNKERQRKLAARARRMESLHPTSTIAIQTNEETEPVSEPEIVKVKKIKKDVKPTKVTKTEKKQKEDKAKKKSKTKSGSIQKVKESKDVSKKKRHNSKGAE
jgi:hypothetical protein